jgi:serine/threonine protein phosphatase PrpC
VTHCSYKTLKGRHGFTRTIKPNQDRFVIEANVCKARGAYLFAVADGHGSKGHEVSSFIKDRLVGEFEATYSSVKVEDETVRTKETLKQTYRNLQSSLEIGGLDASHSGSTLVSVYIKGSALFCANVGDSRAVMGKQQGARWTAFPLSRDHKPDDAKEAERIHKANGVVHKFVTRKGEALGPYRVWGSDDNSPGLAMSRSLGDCIAQTYGVSSEPEVMQVDLDPSDRFVILASDGLWELVGNQEAVEHVSHRLAKLNHEECASDLVDYAVGKWKACGDRRDDITVLVVFLKRHFDARNFNRAETRLGKSPLSADAQL